MTNEVITARLELKELVDRFSDLSDLRDANGLSELFLPDGVLEYQTGFDGEIGKIEGRKNLLPAFNATLANGKALYHINGQQIVTVNGNTAEGISYCQASFVNDEDGKTVITANSIRYSDIYEKRDGKWYIKRRRSIFLISEKREMR